MRIPLKNVLKRQSHVQLAELQDEVVDLVYSVFPKAVLHGGTAIWRCLQGNRFSEDLDFYALVDRKFKQGLEEEIKKRGLFLAKFKQTQNTVFAKISNFQTEVSLEISVRKSPEIISTSFEKTNGSSTEIFTLSPEELLKEKSAAYLNRGLVRDLYDVFFLLGKTDTIDRARKELEKLIKNSKAPVDEKNLKTLVFSGIAPSSKNMLEKIQKRLLA
ncbi:nucleotidyl transferase AbiEii/AbiGii toxin family protein [Candidatus Micrarchaeota archaeon]|nr:nucleotidyl transferase AbiEii/AbiGii toxin family protein [Candidatus Micrarchaeota archaeon]MBU1930905.1 nucleotidyl transferase AbiEii/AbiGii toxin family protein [Candidatus Micrarchaeota archaeon]